MEARETRQVNSREKVRVGPIPRRGTIHRINKSSWRNQKSKGKGKGGKGKDSKGKGKSKSKKVATVEESETSVAQEHQPEPEYSADIATQGKSQD